MAKTETDLPAIIEQSAERTSQLINDGEFAGDNSKFIEEKDVEDIIKEIIITQLQPQYFHFNNQTVISCDHNLQKIPSVIVMVGTEEVFADIEHTPDMNTTIVSFSNNLTGIIIIQ